MAHQLGINRHRNATLPGWDPDRTLTAALAERERFLQKYPQYREYQRQIDGMLDRAGSSENRMAVLALLMEGKLIEMHDQLKGLNRLLQDVMAETD